MTKYVVLLIVLTLATIQSAHADQSTKPLAMTINVTASCEVSIANNIPEHSVKLITEALAASGPVRARCDNELFGGSMLMTLVALRETTETRPEIRVTINF